ncbi:MAG: hypothetical protein E7145_06020 [Rikenellaceae bacterium]|nr:hypothetical protein [Rikenellaceae bacterium]
MKKLKLAVLTLLGFSTACSTVKNATESKTQIPTEESSPNGGTTMQADTTELKPIERIRLMYGVLSPRPTAENQSTEENTTK